MNFYNSGLNPLNGYFRITFITKLISILHIVSLYTFESLSLGDTDDIDHLVLGEDRLDRDLLLEVLASEVNLIHIFNNLNTVSS